MFKVDPIYIYWSLLMKKFIHYYGNIRDLQVPQIAAAVWRSKVMACYHVGPGIAADSRSSWGPGLTIIIYRP